jgi:hypothetical protein
MVCIFLNRHFNRSKIIRKDKLNFDINLVVEKNKSVLMSAASLKIKF